MTQIREPGQLIRIGVLIAALAAIGGCRGLAFLAASEKQKNVQAECDKLGGRRVAVVVWAEPSTLDVYPLAQYHTARHVNYVFEVNRGRGELKGTSFVSATRVNDLQEQLGANGPLLSNADLAERLKVDIVIRIDLYEYTTRAPEANGLIKGRVSGNLAVQRAGQVEPLYRTELSAGYPEDSGIGLLDQSDDEVLNETMRRFADRVARKFYAHQVEYE
ncbi:MAG: hypothetical protein V3T70_11785 [Phycisphaerae bacterium]